MYIYLYFELVEDTINLVDINGKFCKTNMLPYMQFSFLENNNRKKFFGILLPNCSDLLWEKKNSSDQEKLLKLEAEHGEFSKILRPLKQFI